MFGTLFKDYYLTKITNKQKLNAMKTTQSNFGSAMKGISVLLISIVFLTGCNQEELRHAEQQNAELRIQLSNTESTINELMNAFGEVENNLSEIKMREGLINMEATDSELNNNKREKIMHDIQSINTLMEENRKKISDLKKQLEKSGLKVSNMDKKLQLLLAQLNEKEKDIELLKENLTAKDFHIASLNTTLDTLSTKVSEQNSQLLAQASELENLDKQLFTTYFTEGTYQELKEKGVVANDGWTPWDGRKLELNENLSKNLFTEIDKRETTSIPVNAKKANLVSVHPDGSYEFQKNDEGLIASLEIKNPNEFWKISDYLVLEVK